MHWSLSVSSFTLCSLPKVSAVQWEVRCVLEESQAPIQNLTLKPQWGLTATRQYLLGEAGVEGEPSRTWSPRKSVPETEKDKLVSEEWVGLFWWWGKDWARAWRKTPQCP